MCLGEDDDDDDSHTKAAAAIHSDQDERSRIRVASVCLHHCLSGDTGGLRSPGLLSICVYVCVPDARNQEKGLLALLLCACDATSQCGC